MFTKSQLVDKILTSEIWMIRSFNKILDERLVLDEDLAWFDEISKKLGKQSTIPDVICKVVRHKLTTTYINDLLELANGG
jgi:hypothetical protein